MNARELADELEKFEKYGGDIFFGHCAEMLRKQDQLIKSLAKALESASLNRIIHVVKPIKPGCLDCQQCVCDECEIPSPTQPIWSVDDKGNKELVSLKNRVTKPRSKSLSDEEKHKLWDSCRTGIVYDQVMAFGKAIEKAHGIK